MVLSAVVLNAKGLKRLLQYRGHCVVWYGGPTVDTHYADFARRMHQDYPQVLVAHIDLHKYGNAVQEAAQGVSRDNWLAQVRQDVPPQLPTTIFYHPRRGRSLFTGPPSQLMASARTFYAA